MSDRSAPTASDWYRDEDSLAAVLRERRGRRGVRLKGYEILGEIGRGGQGVVYRGVQRSTGRPVAIKVVLEGALAAPTARRRFEREVDIVARMRHPHIVSVYDSGTTEDGKLYYVMEYVAGSPLDEFVRTGIGTGCDAAAGGEPPAPVIPGVGDGRPWIPGTRAQVQRVARLFADVCDAVNFAHQRGVIHRDIKPSNIRVDPAGEARVLDFGLAKTATGEDFAAESMRMSMTGQFLGSLPWASPEQARGDTSAVDVRSDVYSLGVVLYQVLTARFPYDVQGGGLHAALDNILNATPARPGMLNPAVDGELETIILKCLAKEPDRRYQSAGELARDVRHWLAGEMIEARRESAWYTLRKTVRRYRIAAVAASICVLAITAGFAASVVFWRQAEQRRVEAESAKHASDIARQETTVINSFLTDMLASIDPEFAQGRQVSVREVLDAAAASVSKRFANQPLIEASIRDTIGRTYRGLGEHERAREQLARSLEIRRRESPPGDEKTLWTANDLAAMLADLEDFDAAESLLTETLATVRAYFPPDHPLLVTTLTHIGYLRDYQGRLDEAAELYQAALERARRHYGPKHPETLTVMNNLASILIDRDDAAGAEAMLREVVDGRLAALGPEHPQTLTARANLAVVLEEQGKLQEAEQLQRELTEEMARVFGPEHPRTISQALNWVSTLGSLGEWERAATVAGEWLERARGALGEGHFDTLRGMNSLGHCLVMLGRYEQAQALLERALAGMTASFGEEDHRTLYSLQNLAGVYQERGDLKRAEELSRRAVDIRRRTLGDRHTDTLVSINNYASVLDEAGRGQEAEPLFREALAGCRKVLPPGHWMTAIIQSRMGKCLIGLGKYPEAETELSEAYGRLEETYGPGHATPAKTASYLAELYELWDRPEEAATWRARAGGN